MSNITNDGARRIDRQLAISTLTIFFVVGAAFALYQAAFPPTFQITVCEKVPSSNSIKLLDGSTMEVDKAVYDSLSPLTTYEAEKRWFHKPVFMDVATETEQEGDRCLNAP